MLLKIAPDLTLAELDNVVHIARSRRIDGMIVGNTTIDVRVIAQAVKLEDCAALKTGRPTLAVLNKADLAGFGAGGPIEDGRLYVWDKLAAAAGTPVSPLVALLAMAGRTRACSMMPHSSHCGS